MVKRYCIQYSDGSTVKVMCFAGFGAPLFKSEQDAIKYINTREDFGICFIVPCFASKEVAAKQTIKS